MARIVMDTNSIVSAIGWEKGNPRKIFEKCISSEHKLILTQEILDEVTEVLNREKFIFIPPIKKAEFLKYLVEITNFVHSKENLEIIKNDPDDNIILEAALAGKANYIITGDKHLLNLGKFRKVKIVKASTFLDFLSKK